MSILGFQYLFDLFEIYSISIMNLFVAVKGSFGGVNKLSGISTMAGKLSPPLSRSNQVASIPP